MSLTGVCARIVRSVSWLLLGCSLLTTAAWAADGPKMALYTEKELLWRPGGALASSFDVMPLPASGPLNHPILIDGYNFDALADSIPAIKSAYDAGQAIVIVSPSSQEVQGFLDDVTGGNVVVPQQPSPMPSIGEPRLEAIAVRRMPGSNNADIGEFWLTVDTLTEGAAEEKAEDARFVGTIADWLRDKPSATPPPVEPKAAPQGRTLKAQATAKGRDKIDELTGAINRKVSFSFDQGSVSTVVKSWAAYSPGQDEDWYIFEFTTNSQPLNFNTQSANGIFADWEKTDAYCKGILKTACSRNRYATKVQVKVVPKTPGLELMYYGPDSDRAQDEYSYNSKFSLGGKVTAGYDDKGPKAGVELSAGAEFSRSTKVTIKDATLVGISNPHTELAGWRFEMPEMRAVQDLTPYGGPSMNCDNLLQMPYPVQRGTMESRQYAIYRLPGSARARVQGIELAVSLLLDESSSMLQNWTAKYCNIFNCNCSPETWLYKTHELNNNVISFPLAAHSK